MNSPIQSNERIPSFKIECALSAPNFAESVSNPGFRLVLICPPFLELPPHPASSASNTGEGGVCQLSGVQIGTIQSLLADRNTSCSSYNVTLDAILGY